MKKSKHWLGTPPEACDICHAPIKGIFIDGATTRGPWANMCPLCHGLMGRGLGLGRGQEYIQQRNGRWLKPA